MAGGAELGGRWRRAHAACRTLLASLGVWVAAGVPAVAHPGAPPAPHDVWTAWAGEPWVLLGLGVATWLYARGVGALWARAGVGRGIARWRFWCFAGGVASVFVALVSPLDAMGGALFSAHMVQHEVLILAAAPLLALGTPLVAYVWALPPAWRKRVGRWGRWGPVRGAWASLSHPLSAWMLHAVAVWVWHLPALYQATLTSEAAHVAQHVSFFGTALLFWWAILRPGRLRLSCGAGVLYLFTTAAYGSALGALLTFASTPWYPLYAERVAAWGLTALEDQQLGGLIMWVPFGTLYTVAALALFAAWLREVERGTASAAPDRLAYRSLPETAGGPE